MAELDEKLNALLSDPGSMAQIVQMAQQLSATMGGDAGAAVPSSAQTAAPAVPPPAQTPPDGIDPQVVARFLPLLQEYSRSNSQTMQLLYALRPFLKESKQDKVERAAREFAKVQKLVYMLGSSRCSAQSVEWYAFFAMPQVSRHSLLYG